MTDKFVEQFELGVKPWVRPWDSLKCSGPQAPFNHPTTGQNYHGINVLILGMHPLAFQTGDPRFCSYAQAFQKGWQVKKGEKSATVFFTKKYAVRDREPGQDEAPNRCTSH